MSGSNQYFTKYSPEDTENMVWVAASPVGAVALLGVGILGLAIINSKNKKAKWPSSGPSWAKESASDSSATTEKEGLSDSPDKDKKVKNPYGSKGKPDHQKKVKELEEKAKQENPDDLVITEKKIQKEGSNRRPDVQVQDKKTGETKKVYEAERNPQGTRNQKREAEYKCIGVECETHKVGGN